MTTLQQDQPTSDRRDLLVEETFAQATSQAVLLPNMLQRALFPRLLTQDTGLLVPTGPGSGRLEAIVVPLMSQTGQSGTMQRLFVIGPDGGLLDDYLFRLFPMMQASSKMSGLPRTIFLERRTSYPLCRQFLPDGSFLDDACKHPLEDQVDLVVSSFSDFRSLFFGAGGVHALGHELFKSSDSPVMRTRPLFYFDEAQSYGADAFASFQKQVEFLFAEDLDVVVGSTTLPESSVEELSFLETLVVSEAQREPNRNLLFVQGRPGERDRSIVGQVADRYRPGYRVLRSA